MAGYIQPDVVVKALRSVPLFADAGDVSDADLSALSRHVTLVTRRRQGRIFEEGAPSDACYVLIDGRAKVVISGERGSEIILNILEPHCLVGELSLLDGSPRSATRDTQEYGFLDRDERARPTSSPVCWFAANDTHRRVQPRRPSLSSRHE